ncbi:MAG: 2Fe-2S iron-sulfur cluster binding domain-containing protein [Alphaproteobacteria bacterium]|nr:2Fe-2S iron-sulfur cluster binding domain-containing protein [Alphaproteobacteria bacterium]
MVAAPQDSPEGPGFPVRLLNEDEGLDLTIQVFEGEFVLDAADREGLDLPYSCRNGGCTVCTGRLIEGEARMSDDQYTLEEEHVAAGFRLLCCAEVRGPATFLTHQSEEI